MKSSSILIAVVLVVALIVLAETAKPYADKVASEKQDTGGTSKTEEHGFLKFVWDYVFVPLIDPQAF